MPEIFEELDRQADKWEPTAAAISLGSLGLGAGISTTAVGAPYRRNYCWSRLVTFFSYRWVSSWQRMVQDF